MEEVMKFITSVVTIPTLTQETVLEKLEILGVESMTEIVDVKFETDFPGIITVIQARQLQRAVEKLSNEAPLEVVTTSPLLPVLATATTSLASATPTAIPETSRNADHKSLYFYKVPWEKFPPDVMRAAREGKFADPSDRKEIVRIVVADMMDIEEYPSMREIRKIAMGICSKYPLTFGDRWSSGDSIGEGHMSLERQLKWRVDHVREKKRVRLARHSQLKQPATKRKDRYGTVKFMPSVEASLHSVTALQAMQQWLKDEFQKEQRDEGQVLEYMQNTYPLQRHSINCQSMLRDIRRDWPFLFTKVHLTNHFTELMGFESQERIKEEVLRIVDDHLLYFSSFRGKKTLFGGFVRDVFQKLENEVQSMERKFLTVLMLIGEHLKQETALFWRPYPETSILAEVSADQKAPNTPHLALLGVDLISAKTAFVVMAEHEAMDEIVSTYEALFMVLEAYFVFNCQYPPKAACLLEYLARYIMLIEGEGSKTKRTKTTPKSHEPKLLTLMRKIYEYHSARHSS